MYALNCLDVPIRWWKEHS